MARAQGARALMALAFETTYGTPPASGFTRMPFASTSLGAEQPLLNSELLGYAKDISEADARAALQQLDPLWDELFPAEQARIVALLVERVDIGTDGLNVRLRMDGLGGLAREMLADSRSAAA